MNVERKCCTYNVNLTWFNSADWTSTSTQRQSESYAPRLRSTSVSPKVPNVFYSFDSILYRVSCHAVIPKFFLVQSRAAENHFFPQEHDFSDKFP